MERPMWVISKLTETQKGFFDWIPIAVTTDQQRAVEYRDKFEINEACINRVEMV